MTGVSYITNQKGETTHLILDLSKHQKDVLAFLEDLEDIESIKNANPNDTVSLSEVRDFIIANGVSEETLSPIPNDV